MSLQFSIPHFLTNTTCCLCPRARQCSLCTLFLKRFYLFIHESYRQRQRHRQREKQAPCRKPDVGLNPGILRSRPESKADVQPLSHPGVPHCVCTLKPGRGGCLGSSVVGRLPLAQGLILESEDRVPHWAPHIEPASPSAYVSASVCLS